MNTTQDKPGRDGEGFLPTRTPGEARELNARLGTHYMARRIVADSSRLDETATGSDVRLYGVCCQMDYQVSDLLFGLADGEETGYSSKELGRFAQAGRLLCQKCPVRLWCLAQGIVWRQETGLYGGFNHQMLGTFRAVAEAYGIPLSAKDRKRVWRLVHDWLASDPMVIKGVEEAQRARWRSYKPAPGRTSVPVKEAAAATDGEAGEGILWKEIPLVVGEPAQGLLFC